MKKGQAEMLEWFPRLILMLVAVLVIAMLVRYYAHREIDVADLHRATYLYRIHYDGNIITYTDNTTGRVYPGIIDIKKFTDKTLNDKFGFNGKISSCLTITGSCIQDTMACHDKETFEQYLPFARLGTLGPGSATFEENVFPVTIKADSECTGILNITIVRPNS